MNELLAFIIAILLSFWGSLQLGLVNVQVIHTALTKNKRHALIMAAGGALPEIIYATLAILAVDKLKYYQPILDQLGLIVIPVFFALGMYFLLKKATLVREKKTAGGDFRTGFSLAMINPQLIVYWTIMFIYVGEYVNLEKGTFFAPKIFLVLGTAVGAFLALYFFIVIAIRYKSVILNKMGGKLDKIIGVIFLVLGTIELVKWMYK
jgi:threonine/homoserine/homoserine lactone efflux protein